MRPEAAAARFLRDGFLPLRGAFEAALVGRLLRAYRKAFLGRKPKGMLTGNRRRMITVPVRGPFNDPALYANRAVLKPLIRLLGPDLVLNSFGSVTAFPGARAQHVHFDHPPLFGTDRRGASVPPYAVTAAVPLVAMNRVNGSTRVWKGSHREPFAETPSGRPTTLATEPGDAFLFDYRLWHGGTPNRGRLPRPLLYIVYSRPWFRDSVNFSLQEPLVLPEAEFNRVPAELRPLFRLRG